MDEKDKFVFIALITIVILSVILKGCVKQESSSPIPYYVFEIPKVITSVPYVSDSSAVFEGTILFTGNSAISDCGFYFSEKSTSSANSEILIDNIKPYTSGTNARFRDTVTKLIPNKIYNVRAFVKNEKYSSNSAGISFTTYSTMPLVFTSAILECTKSSAVVGGKVTNGGMTSLIGRGLYWGSSSNPETSGTKIEMGNGLGSFSILLTGLSPNTNYYIKAFAINGYGASYGIENRFNTGQDTVSPKVTDIDGNVYHIVKIGNQVWMAENLKTTKYNDNTPIPLVTDDVSFGERHSPAFCWYNNSEFNKSPYGGLYNWFVVNTGKLCPIGWHVPTDAEWTTLTDFMGGENAAGAKLKETGTDHWTGPNIAATDQVGFTGLPGGDRFLANGGKFSLIGSYGFWWSSTAASSWERAWYRCMTYSEDNVFRGEDYGYQNGFSVRCIKNN
jgi:uncharacterized protein (TIGR02145 family)